MKKIIAILSTLFAINANAILIDNGSYITDTATSTDWLKLGNTLGLSSVEVYAKTLPGGEFEGWRYASGLEWDALLIGQGFAAESCSGGVSFCGNGTETSGSGANTSISGSNAWQIMNLIGYVSPSLTSLPYASSMGMLSDIDTATGKQWATSLFIDEVNGVVRPWVQTHALLEPQMVIPSGQWVGSWLVRQTAVPASEPASVLALGLLLLMRFCRRPI